ncbi:protein TolQ [Desulfoglaeba alkanexedens]|jgi:biopolymer transport protein TolQ|uniref:Protein TolQ n=1 Tax=Desulfoglaeba alkanexedens ALDC TaxID=980445 RepID=A0A4P8L874_9BACT|nr:protein TolQ [Desulfoglaeba alkanexedens]QCQ22822.1 protein TolQ [Desulfoglaeba alkanexedens ALDC]
MLWLHLFKSTLQTATAVAAPYERIGNGVGDMIWHAGPVVKFVMLLLFAMSLACWCVIFMKLRYLQKVRRETDRFLDLYEQRKNFSAVYRETQTMEYSPMAQIFRRGYMEWMRSAKMLGSQNVAEGPLAGGVLFESVERAVDGVLLEERQRMERFVPFLATTGSSAPFIGLFGTVWGIMTSFQDIGLKGAANLAVVAPGISEALVATAMGLVAAIPAVIAYNHFVNRFRVLENEMQHFASDFLNLMKREWYRRAAPARAEGETARAVHEN